MLSAAPAQDLTAQNKPALLPNLLLAALAAGLIFACYVAGLAPGLTWAHQGADGGELLAAAVSNGVPHPPGYPLYTLLLQGWLALAGLLAPASDLAWRGNLLSALLGALAAGLTTFTAARLLTSRARLPLALAVGVAWGLSPLLWSQSIITEVYALHALIVALLGYCVLAQGSRPWLLALPAALGMAHHPTLLLLLPAALYRAWSGANDEKPSLRRLVAAGLWIGVGLAAGALLMLRTFWAARAGPPVNWGYADSWQGLWWLISGAAYRTYLFAVPAQSMAARVAAWATTLAAQFSLAGLLAALGGLAWLDNKQPRLRTFGLLWIVPVSVYAIGYYTRDSQIYLLPVGWMLALWIGVGLEQGMLELRTRFAPRLVDATTAAALLLWLGLSLIVRWPALSLRHDRAARDFVAGAAAVLEPNSIVVSRSDAETFALWYGTWGSGELLRAAPGLVPVNDSLYQFDWYARQQAELYPDLPGAGISAAALVEANAGQRPIYYAETLPELPAGRLVTVPPLWRDVAPAGPD